MTDGFVWLVLANAIIWAGFGFYLLFIGLEQKKLARKLSELKALEDE